MQRTIHDQSRPGGRALLVDLERQEDFVPGQVLGISMRPEDTPRWYSIASSPDMPDYQIIYTPVDGGLLTPQLADLEPGAKIWLWPPKGSFRDPDPDLPSGGRVWWICNGTGIAPFVSFFRSGIRQKRTLVHGAMNRDEAWFRDIFLEETGRSQPSPGSGQDLQKSSPDPDGFRYIPCLSRDGSQDIPGAWTGRLSAWLAACGPSLFGPEDHFLLCGSPGMIVQVREHLVSLGFGHERISSEIYF